MFFRFRNRNAGRPRALAVPTRARNALYVSRPAVEKALADAWADGGHVVIYGPSHQGKTTLLARQLAGTDAVYIECRPDFKRTQIYRVLLSSLGYGVTVEKKKRGKATATVKLGFSPVGGEVSAEGETEQVVQAVSVDLKNPSEVAHLISRLDHVPRLVLNNFQLLDLGTKENLLFDLTFFSERPCLRTVIVGTWTNEEYLEEIEPAVTGRFKYVFVPMWTDAELREAAGGWARLDPASRIDEFLAMSGGDVSLFRGLLETCGDSRSDAANSAASQAAAVQTMVLSRFRRGLATKLKALLAQRDSYVSYLAMTAKSQLVNNPEFRPIPNALAADYLMTTIDPRTNRPYSGGEAIRLDRKGQPQFIEAATAEVGEAEAGLAPFLLRQFHAAVGTGSQSIDLDTLMRDFQQQLEPQPIAVDESRLRAAFTRLIDVQRQALIVPYMMAFNAADDAIEIVDRRLFLYLKSVSIDDLEDLLDDVAPQDLPRARRRNRLSPEMTEEEQAAHIRTATGDRQQHDPSGDSVKEAEPVRASRGRNAKTAAHRRSLVEHPIRPVVSG